MTEQNHNFEIETALLHFQSALDGTVINRYAGDWSDPNNGLTNRSTEQRIKVNYVFGPKQRIIADLEGKTDTVKFPIVAICPTGMGRDDARIKNKNDNIRIKLPDGNYGNYQVVPWNINVSVTIMTRFQEDMTQIISNFAVLSNPYFVFSWKEPKTGLDVRAEVYYDGQMAMEYPGASSDLPPNAPFRTMGTANFIIKTYLYRTEIDNTAKICKINTDIIVPNKFYCNYDLLSDPENINGIDEYTTLGKPQLWYVDNYYFKSGDAPTVLIQGDGFALTEAVYVSGSNPNMYDTKEYDIDGFKFSGKLVTDFELLDAQNIQFNLPPPSSFGFVDVIITNDCGYGLLTEGANRCSRVENPYKPTDPKYTEWRVLQFPYLNGLIVSSDLNSPVYVTLNDTIIVYNPGINEAETLTSCSPAITIKNISDKGSESVFSTVNSFSSFWNDAYFNLISYSALYLGDVTIDLGDVNTLSANWNSVYNTVNISSASDWNYQGNDLKELSALWQDAYDNLISYSALYLIDADTIVDISELQSASSLWNSVYNTVNISSASDWNYQGNDLKTLSSNWQDAYNNLIINSALYLELTDISEIQSTSSTWNDITTVVQSNSTIWDEDVNSFVYNNSASIIDNATIIQEYSAQWLLSGIEVEDDPIFTMWAQTYSAYYDSSFTTTNENSAKWSADYLPLTGGTVDGQVTITNFLSSPLLKIDTVHTLTSSTKGDIFWDINDDTLAIDMGNGVVQQVGFEQYIEIKANGSNIDNGTVVWATDAVSSGNSGIIRGANGLADGNTPARFLLGVATENILSGENGRVTTFGVVREGNLGSYADSGETWAVGQILYPSPTIIGGWTNIEPVAPNLAMPIAFILFVNNGITKSNVTMMVRVDNGYDLHEIHDVLITSPEFGDILTYNEQLSAWVNSSDINSILQTNSGNWNDVVSVVNLNSASFWNYQGIDLKQLSAIWQSTSLSFQEQSANNISVVSTVHSYSSNWNDVYDNITTLSAEYLNEVDLTLIQSSSALWDSAYTTTNSNSSRWEDVYNTIQTSSANGGIGVIGITIDGAGNPITIGRKASISIPYDAEILDYTLLADISGSIIIDIRRSTFNDFPSTTSICSSNFPFLSTALKNSDSDIIGWDTTVQSGDIFEFYVNENDLINRATLTMKVTKY